MRIVLAVAAFAAIPVAAQTPSSASQSGAPHATLRGVAVDSVHGGFLKGASIAVIGPSRMGLTDSLGRFIIDSIPPGEYTVALFDSFLDSLSISVVSPPTRFAPGDTVALILAIPSQPTIVAAKCGPPATQEESAALFGRVMRAADGSLVLDASIRVEWLDITIDKENGVRTLRRQRVAKSDSGGRYSICGLPIGLAAEVSAIRGDDSTSAVPIMYGDSRIGMANLFLPGSIGVRTARTAGAPVRGQVVDASGRAIANALVTLSSSPTAVTTEPNGSFEIAGLSLGTQTVLVRRLGFQPVEVVVNVMPQSAAPVTVRLDQFVPILQSVVIEARRNAGLERVGFARRKRFGLGRYYEAADFQHVSSLEKFFQTIPVLKRRIGLPRVTVSSGGAGDPQNVRDAGPGSAGRAARARRAEPQGSSESGSCTATFIDGVRTGAGQFLTPNEIAAVEVYSALMTPAEFRGFGNCRTILIWTDWKLRRGN